MAVLRETSAVVIPCRNEAPTIATLLDALAVQSCLPRCVVVVDDASTDGTLDTVETWAGDARAVGLRIVPGPARGVAAAMNAGINAAEADIIVRLDGHCRPDPTYIQHCLETLALPGAGVAGGVWNIQPGSDTLAARGIAAVLSHPLGAGGADYRQTSRAGDGQVREVDTVPFGTFRRELWERLGGFDEALLRNEDYDFNHRVRLTGLKVMLNPAIVSAYKARPTFGALARQYFAYGYWKIVMLRKFPRSIRLRQLLPMMLVPSLLGLAAWAVLGTPQLPLLLLAAYFALDFGGALQAAIRARDLRLVPFAFTALLVLQNAWSAGAWTSLLKGARAGKR